MSVALRNQCTHYEDGLIRLTTRFVLFDKLVCSSAETYKWFCEPAESAQFSNGANPFPLILRSCLDFTRPMSRMKSFDAPSPW